MRVLFSSTRGTGHFTPLVPLIDACLRGGHEVLVAGPPPLAPTVEARGYPFWEGANPPEDELGEAWGRVPTVSPEEANAIVVGEIFGRLNVRAMLPRLMAACEEWRPGVLIREQAEFAGAIAAERHGIPHARLAVSFGLLDAQGLEFARPALESQEAGIVERIWESPYLTFVPPGMEAVDAARPPVVHRFRDPAVRAHEMPAVEPPLVYVSFGSVAADLPVAPALWAGVLEAADGLPARVLLALGNREADVAALGPLPPNVRVEPWVNPAEVLAEASAAVSHGGFGTTLGAIGAGLPLVVVPLFGDQPDTARAVEAAGPGVALWPDPDGPPPPLRSSIDAAGLREAITTVLEEPGYRRIASRLAAEMAEQAPADQVLDALGLT